MTRSTLAPLTGNAMDVLLGVRYRLASRHRDCAPPLPSRAALHRSKDAGGLGEGLGYLKQALEIDPEFALAWAQRRPSRSKKRAGVPRISSS